MDHHIFGDGMILVELLRLQVLESSWIFILNYEFAKNTFSIMIPPRAVPVIEDQVVAALTINLNSMPVRRSRS